jgi:hypothetical protein
MHFTGSGSKPPLIFDCHIVGNDRENVTASEAAFLSSDSLGCVIWNTLLDGTEVPDGVSIANKGMGGAGVHVSSPRAWTTASTMGAADTNGLVNVYIEESHQLLWGQFDIDVAARVVFRQSTLNGTSVGMHGFTSGITARHAEVYDCDMINTVDERNCTRYFWCRGGTCLFTDNDADDNNTGFGTPSLLDIGDNTTPSGPYPVDMAPGRGHNGTSHGADPIYIWGNTGDAATSWDVDPVWDSHVVEDRDIFVSLNDDDAKPGYSKFTYPHPLREVIEGGGTEPAGGTRNLTIGGRKGRLLR